MQPACMVLDDEAPSTSGAEEPVLALESSARARTARKAAAVVAAVAAAALVVALAGTSSTRRATSGEGAVGLQGVELPRYAVFPGYGCKNWDSHFVRKHKSKSEDDCSGACDASHKCIAYNFQMEACEKGWYKDNACLLFEGPCKPEKNKCWGLHYKLNYRDEDAE